MQFCFLDKDGRIMYRRSDAEEFLHYCEDFAFSASFPQDERYPLEAGMRVCWMDQDGLWEVHEITQVEQDAWGGRTEISGCHIALAELRDTLIPEVLLDGSRTIAEAAEQLLEGTGWSVGIVPAQLEPQGVQRERYRVSTSGPRLHMRSGPGTGYASL